jgi:type II secretory pathway pseudopilin PulG
MLNKKGAMFGLDARIALAIFGALSVISGAALYSAIQQSKAVAMVNSLEEIGKAIDSYRLETDDLAKAMDKFIDGGDGGAAGRMRWYYESASVKYNYFYQYSVVENPNN